MNRRATDERMSAEAFDALAKLSGLHQNGAGYRAARLVLVDGIERAEAARAVGVTRDTLKATLWRYAKRRELARQAAQSVNINNNTTENN